MVPVPPVSPALTVQGISLVFYSSHFCEPCARTREVLRKVAELLPSLTIVERDVVDSLGDAEIDGIRSTPTVIIRDGEGEEVVRAEGVPTLSAVLVAVSRAAEHTA